MEKHVPAAVDFTRTMESKKKPDGLLLFLRGDCYNKLGLIDKAMDDYTKAAELNPKGANSHRHPVLPASHRHPERSEGSQ